MNTSAGLGRTDSSRRSRLASRHINSRPLPRPLGFASRRVSRRVVIRPTEYDEGYTQAMKTAISLPDDLFSAADRTARGLGLSRSELFRRALLLFLQRHDDRLVTEALNRVYGAGRVDSSLPPAVAELQARSIPTDDW